MRSRINIYSFCYYFWKRPNRNITWKRGEQLLSAIYIPSYRHIFAEEKEAHLYSEKKSVAYDIKEERRG